MKSPGFSVSSVTAESADFDPRVARSRAKLLDAATELLVESGARGVTVDGVVERSGVAKSTLYRHWNSRTEMLTDVVRSNVPQMEMPDLTGGFDAALRSLVDQLVTTLADPRWACIMPAMFALKRQIPEVAMVSEQDHHEKTAVLRAVLELGAAEGAIPAGLDPELVGYELFGPLLLAAVVGSEIDTAKLSGHLVDRFLASYR